MDDTTVHGFFKLQLWVLNHCENEEHVLRLLQECAPEMNTTAVQAAFKVKLKIYLRSLISFRYQNHIISGIGIHFSNKETASCTICDSRNN